jgi:hypothetical protein
MCGKRRFSRMVAKIPFGSSTEVFPCREAASTLPIAVRGMFTAPTATFSRAAADSKRKSKMNGETRFNPNILFE